ncbi:cytochrome c1 protein [Ideonella alba]|uniref:Cytochrome c1 protein n=1 Tax=Ideonella alba TaxID=2824118 RepID=A0A940YCF2_9BURK|nr:cytochrome c1 protein [Ideonella alba]MBQ0930536.1 cytochrome c1 protein [Ideonella alba]
MHRTSTAHRAARRLARVMAGAALLAASLTPAWAVPSFARQTGSECAACHIGAFGPQLTPFGQQFKINGYTETDGKDGKVPLSAMMIANLTRSAKDLPEVPDHFKANNNSAIQETSAFLAGRLTDHIGAFVQSTYAGVDRAWALDQLDLRYARSLTLGDKETTVGLAINGNPTLTDPFNTLGQWRFPYTASDFGFGQGPTPMMENLAGAVLGANLYALHDKHWYGELGLYKSLSTKAISAINAEDVGRLSHPALYWRLAYLDDRKRDNWHVGLSGLSAALAPDRGAPSSTDHFSDWGLDAGYQWLGNREHIYTLNASWMHEGQKLNATQAAGGASSASGSLKTWRLTGSYTWQQTWGATAGLFGSSGSADTGLWGGSSYSARPDTNGYMLQLDWTPWGKESSWGSPWANLRVGLQYTGYSKFNGGSHYIDDVNGVDRRARDNNTTMLFFWWSL